MGAAIPLIVQYGAPWAIKGVMALAGYIAGRIHQHRIEQKPPKPPATAMPQ
jgi:hypothetical protein